MVCKDFLEPKASAFGSLLAERVGFEPTDGCPSTDFERICFPPFCRRQRGLWAGRRDLRTPFLRYPGRGKGTKNADISMGSGHFLHSNNFSFFPCGNSEAAASTGSGFPIVFCTKPSYTHFAGKTTQKIRECTEVLWWGCSLLRRADGKEQRWQNRRKPSTPSTSAT